MVAENRLCQRGIQKIQHLVIAFPRFGGFQPAPGYLLRDPGGATDLQSASGQMIEHANLFDNPPRLVKRQHHTHGSKAQPLGSLGKRRDHQIGRWAVGVREMVFGKKYTLKAKRFGAFPFFETGFKGF